jgi:hypothetical protein
MMEWTAPALRSRRTCQTQGLPEVSRDLLIPARAAPSCVRRFEVPGSAKPSRHAARHITE